MNESYWMTGNTEVIVQCLGQAANFRIADQPHLEEI